MGNIIDKNFSFEKYGLKVRLVNESDAEFIVKLRTDKRLSTFIHSTKNDVEKQVEWIKKYKYREYQGLEYYFIYIYNGERMGVNRLYDIGDDDFTGGSFIFKKKCPFEYPVFATLIQLDIAFNFLNKKIANGDIRLGNKKVIKFHKLLKVKFTSQDELNMYYVYHRDVFNKQKCIIEDMLI